MTSPSELLSRCDFPSAGTSVDLAVSGGPDSLALLVLAAEAGLVATAIHVDHGLRDGSAVEADCVAAAAARYGLAFRAESVLVDDGPNLEARAREARYGVLPAGVLTGHTADDRAETVVLNLLRGAGLDGLSSLRRGPQHPLLDLRRAETRALCEAVGLEPVEDPTNLDSRFRRNRVRNELLPLLDDIADRDVVPILCRQADLLADDADLLARQSADINPRNSAELRDGPAPLARRAIRDWLRPLADGQPPDAATVERVLAVARGEAVATEVGRGFRVARTEGRLRRVTSTGDAWQDGPDAGRDEPHG